MTVEDILVKLQLACDAELPGDIGEFTVVEECHDIREPYVVIQVEGGARYTCKLSDRRADARLVVEEEELA